MEDYFHLNLKKFIAEAGADSGDVKPNATANPSKVADHPVSRRSVLQAEAERIDGADNTDPYNSTGRFKLKFADG